MSMQTIIDVQSIPPISHKEAMHVGETEAARLLQAVDRLARDDWSRATDCIGWDVKALLSHVLGAMEANAKATVFVRQFVSATKAAKRSGRPMIDEMTAAQVRDHEPLTPDELRQRLHDVAPAALRGRRRMPGVLRSIPMKPGDPIEGTWKVGYLIDVIMNRDYWMHRVDLARATEAELQLSPEHDGRIVADVVAEWAKDHRQPFILHLDGPAGGHFGQGSGGQELRVDAIEFCRILSGRGSGSGLLTHPVPF
jgi:uncharacterized protein (TIGR03083 family)